MPTKTEDVEAKYGVVINFPNLELHSAAASGNVGLVHYALTHGQPVNSVLHGVLPLHAACSGGSVEVVRMLIERGANVNAPRLPRRYSDGRKSNAPSVGTAGSTPLHFAAANGHAPIVQILLACGATPDKPDKNGMTPESLAEIQGHTEVIRVIQTWGSLHPTNSYHDDTNSEAAEIGSPSVGESAMSEDGWYEGQLVQPSRKGKERAFSFSSAKSELNVPAIKVKSSIEGFFRRASRSGSNSNTAESNRPTPLRISTHSDGSTEISNPGSPAYYSTFVDSAPNSPHIETVGSGLDLADQDGDDGADTPLTRVTSGNSTILAPAYMSFRASSPSSNVSGGSSTVLASARQPRNEPQVQDTIDETESNASQPSEYEAALESFDHEEEGNENQQQESEDQSGQEEAEETIQEIPAHHRHAAPSRHGFSSRRPSLPAILEKAAHPGQTFRNAMRRDRHASDSSPNTPEDTNQPKSGSFLRGRKTTTNEPSPPHSAGRRFGSIKGFFRRTNSPPSRSPSPPKRNELLPDELDERLRRVSLDMSQSEGSSADARDEVFVPPMPNSAPPTKTRFFEDLSDNSDLRMAALASLTPKTSPLPPPVRKVSGGVLVPSPLAREWREQDIAPQSESKFRRTRTEVYRNGTPSPRHSAPGTPVYTKRRSATLPSQPRGLDWDEEVNLRRAAASEVIRRNSEKLRQAVVEAEAQTDDGRSEVTESEAGDVTFKVEALDAEVEQTPHVSDGEKAEGPVEAEVEAEGEDLTPEATPSAEKSAEKSEPTLDYHPDSPNRLRGASIGSFTTDSTRLSTPSQSTNPHMSVVSHDVGSEMYPNSSRSPKYQVDKIALRQPPPSVITGTGTETRPRGNTVSSSHSSGGTSGMNFSSIPSASTPNTSLTPTSAIGTTFPPVPEHEVSNANSTSPTPQKALTREEAKNLVKQNEMDILSLAQLPPSLDSSRSLAAQLAAYGENHQLEQQIAAEERRAKRRAARTRSRASDADDSESNVSASGSGESSSGRTTGSSALRMTTIKHDKDGMYRVEAPKNQIPSINTIYDKRAAAYREKLQALTSLPPTVPPSFRQGQTLQQQQQQRHNRPRAYSSMSARQQPHSHSHAPHLGRGHSTSSSSASSVSMSMRHTSSPFPSSSKPHGHGHPSYPSSYRSTQTQQDASRYTLHPQTPPGTSFMTAPSSAMGNRTMRKSSAPAPIADVINTRFSGMPAPPPAPPMSASPYVSIFSSRYSGHPHDGGDSDDTDSEPQRYTVIENDWRGGHIVDKKIDHEGLKRNKWGQLKGAIGHLGRKTS